MARQADRSQAFNDIFGRPSASRPSAGSRFQQQQYQQQPAQHQLPQQYYHQQAQYGHYPLQPPLANVVGQPVLGPSRPISQGPQYYQQYSSGDQPPHSPVNTASRFSQEYISKPNAPPASRTSNYSSSSPLPGLPEHAQRSSSYNIDTGTQSQRSSYGAANTNTVTALSTPSLNGSQPAALQTAPLKAKTSNSSDPRGSPMPATTPSASFASQQGLTPSPPLHAAYQRLPDTSDTSFPRTASSVPDTPPVLPVPVQLPSLDVTSEYYWFDARHNGTNAATGDSGGDYTNLSTPSAGSVVYSSFERSGESSYNSDYTSRASNSNNVSLKSYPASSISASDLPKLAEDIDATSERVSPASLQSNQYSDGTNYYGSLAKGLETSQHQPLLSHQKSSLDRSSSIDSDHTSYYVPSYSTDARQFHPSVPSSTTTHTYYAQQQAPYSPQQYHQSAYPKNGSPFPSQHQFSPQPNAYQNDASYRHASSRRSSESMRVLPTQQKAPSGYGERAFSFSGVDRPEIHMRPASNSPRPSSSISHLPNQLYMSSPGLQAPHSFPSPHLNQQHQQMVSRRTPVVYPALLSRVAEAFKSRITLAERTKDGLSYKDAFDGREAVDKIAYIIRTTDRNLALLLGRALDAQKFFHDVTYDHRLRDSPNELYQFRERLHASPFGTSTGADAALGQSDDPRFAHILQPPVRPPSPTDTMLSEDSAVPSGVFTLLTDCYSPTCTRDRLCYSIACPRRLEQQARLNMKPKPGLKKSNSEEGLLLDDARLGSEPGMLWIHMVSKEVSDSVDDKEKKRQEAINELIYTERDFVRDLEYLRDTWMTPLKTGAVIPEQRREAFVKEVFWNTTEIHAVNIKLAEALTRRQKTQPIVESIGDIFLKVIPDFGPFVKYGAHQLYGKYEFEKEKGSNPAFAKFVETTERLPESRKLELNGYLTKPTTRLARYPLLLEAILKVTPEGNPDKEYIPKCVKLVRDYLGKVNHESGRSEARFNLAQLDQQLVFKPGEAVDLKLRDEKRDLIFKGSLKRRGGTASESAELQVFLFDHAILMVKAKSSNKNEQYKVYRRPIPLELLLVTTQDDAGLRASTARPKSLMSRTSNTSRLNLTSNGASSKTPIPDPTSKQGFPITFTYLGRKGYTMTLWSPSWAGRKKWLEKIEERQNELKDLSLIFETSVLSEGYFVGTNRVTCAAPYDGGTRMVFGTDNGVYLANLLAKDKVPIKVISVASVTQVDVLEDYGILIVLADRAVQTFSLEALDPQEAVVAAKRARKISTNASFFKTGVCLNRTLVCIVKSGTVSSTIKTLEPIDHHGRSGKKQPTIRKLLQGGNELLKIYKEFYIPTESSSVHFLKSKLCVGCTKGFEIVDLDTLDTQGLLDPADSSLDFVQKRENVRPLAIYRVDGDFLLCYDEFAFYVNKNGWRARSNWLVQWEGSPSAFALHYPYILAFEPNFIEVRHVDNGNLMQIIPGLALRLLFADTPPSSSSAALAAAQAQAAAAVNQHQHYPYSPQLGGQGHGHFRHPGASPMARQPMYGGMGGGGGAIVGGGSPYESYNPPVRLPGPRKQIIFTSDAGVLTLRKTG